MPLFFECLLRLYLWLAVAEEWPENHGNVNLRAPSEQNQSIHSQALALGGLFSTATKPPVCASGKDSLHKRG